MLSNPLWIFIFVIFYLMSKIFIKQSEANLRHILNDYKDSYVEDTIIQLQIINDLNKISEKLKLRDK